MFSSQNKNTKKNSAAKRGAAIPSIISADLNILGNLISEGMIDVDGRIEGNVRAHYVKIRKDGKIIGDIQADEVHIHGSVRGLVRAKDVHLYSTSHVEGNIMHEVLSIEDGADVNGQFKRIDRVRLQEGKEGAASINEHSEDDIRLLENLRLISNHSNH